MYIKKISQTAMSKRNNRENIIKNLMGTNFEREHMNIYSIKVKDISQDQIEQLCEFINIEKKYKIQNYIHKKDKIRTLFGEILIRSIAKEKLNIKNKDIIFNKNEYGKPFLKGYPKFNFNISHSGDFVVCAVDNESIGIDVEEVKAMEYKEIAKRFFNKEEVNYILKEELEQQLDKFYEIWTLKESYIKCRGKGLSIPLESFTIEMSNNTRSISINDKCYKLKNFDVEAGYKIAVCSLNSQIIDTIINIESKKLVNMYLSQ